METTSTIDAEILAEAVKIEAEAIDMDPKDIEALVATARRAAAGDQTALAETRVFLAAAVDAFGSCDHGANICGCGLRGLLADVDAALAAPAAAGGTTI